MWSEEESNLEDVKKHTVRLVDYLSLGQAMISFEFSSFHLIFIQFMLPLGNHPSLSMIMVTVKVWKLAWPNARMSSPTYRNRVKLFPNPTLKRLRKIKQFWYCLHLKTRYIYPNWFWSSSTLLMLCMNVGLFCPFNQWWLTRWESEFLLD